MFFMEQYHVTLTHFLRSLLQLGPSERHKVQRKKSFDDCPIYSIRISFIPFYLIFSTWCAHADHAGLLIRTCFCKSYHHLQHVSCSCWTLYKQQWCMVMLVSSGIWIAIMVLKSEQVHSWEKQQQNALTRRLKAVTECNAYWLWKLSSLDLWKLWGAQFEF